MIGPDISDVTTSRRSFSEELVKASVGISMALLLPTSAHASGGATAGGAYLLSGTWTNLSGSNLAFMRIFNICLFANFFYIECLITSKTALQ